MLTTKSRNRAIVPLIALCVALAAMISGKETTVAQLPGEPKMPEGMTTYCMGFLRKGPNWTAEKTPESAEIQKGHMAHLNKMADTGKLIGAGPLLDNGDLRGILIFKLTSPKEAEALASEDPAVKAGRLRVEVHPWMGQEGIGQEYFDRVKADPNARVSMLTMQFGLLVKGPKWTAEASPTLSTLQQRHLKHIFSLLGSGDLAAAGPFLDDDPVRGVLVFRKESVEAARALAEADPAVQSGHLAVEMHPWMVADGVMPSRKK